MITNLDKCRADLKKLSSRGVDLLNAMQVEQYPERVEDHFKNVLKKDYDAFKRNLPSFVNSYQDWYSEAQVVIKLFLPDRFADFNRLYEPSKSRKDIRQDNYVIEDYLRDLRITTGFDKKLVVGPDAAIPQFQQQLNILNAINSRFESSLYDTERMVKADLFDSELVSALELVKNNLHRAAGAICGVILEKTFEPGLQSSQFKAWKKKSYNKRL